MDGIGNTAQNLQAAIDGETYEYTEMYPLMVELGVREQHRANAMEFAVGRGRPRPLKWALEAAKAGKDLQETEFTLCPACATSSLGVRHALPDLRAKPEKFVLV